MEDVERGSKANLRSKISYCIWNNVKLWFDEKDIAIITPYNGQVNLLRSVLLDIYPSVEVRSVDDF